MAKTDLEKARHEILGQLNDSSLRSISMRHSLTTGCLVEEAPGKMKGEPAPKGLKDLMMDALSDAQCVPATLTSIGKDEACWRLRRSEVLEVCATISIGPGWSSGMFDANDKQEFSKWCQLAIKTLEDSGRNPKKLGIPGMLSLSVKGKVVFGWQEDEDHPDAMLLAIGEVMST